MSTKVDLGNVVTLREVLAEAEQGGYAVGSFSPRLTPLIQSVLRAGEKLGSPLIVQISQKELVRGGITPAEFAGEFYSQMNLERINVPIVLHLDHTTDIAVIEQAIAAGFTSVMIDASDKPLRENIERTRRVVELGRSHGVSVEGELGRIGTTDFAETDSDEEGYTDPEEARVFVEETGVDALAVSVGTAHGLYGVRRPHIDYPRLQAIRALTPVHLVLHGGSDVPAPIMLGAIRLAGGGVSKINIATDLEVALLTALGLKVRLTNAECKNLSWGELELARAAVEQTVSDKIRNFVCSEGKAEE